MSTLKSKFIKVVAALTLAGTMGAATSTSANAGNLSVDLYLGSGQAIHYSGNSNSHHRYKKHGQRRYKSHSQRSYKNHGQRHKSHRRTGSYNSSNYYPGYANPYRGGYRHTSKHRRHQYRSSHRSQVCGPRRAVNKAYRLGLNNPQVHRIKDRRIVVSGYQYGYRTKMVFKRYSNCSLMKTVNFKW